MMWLKTLAVLISASWFAALGPMLPLTCTNARWRRCLVRRVAALACCFAVFAGFLAHALAAPIMFTHTGTGSGTIDEVSFSDAEFTITALGATENRQVTGPGLTYFIDHDSASIEINGVGTLEFVTATRTFVNPVVSLVGFSRAGSGGFDLFNGPNNVAFSTWDMLDSIGPINGSGVLLLWDALPVVTDAGVLVFSDSTSIATFQAVVVPEPASMFLMLIGVVVLGVGFYVRQLLAAAIVARRGSAHFAPE